MPTVSPEEPRVATHTPAGAPALESSPPRGRSAVVVSVLGACIVLVAAATAVLASSGADDHHAAGDHHGAPPSDQGHDTSGNVLRPVGGGLTRRVPGSGPARLDVAALVAPAAGRLTAIPAGTPVRLRFTLPGPARGAMPSVRAARMDLPAGDGGDEQAAHKRRAASREPVSLQREATVLVDRRRGQVAIPNQSGGRSHQHAPGQGLASTMPGGGYEAAATISPGATATAVDPGGRFLAAAYSGAGRVELVDLLLGRRAGAIRTGGRPTALAFAPDGRLWVTDRARGRVAVVDPARRLVSASLAIAGATGPVAFGPHGDRAIVAGRAGAALVDARRARVLATASVSAPSVGAGWSGDTGAFAVGGADGTVTLVPVDGRAGRLRRIDLGVKEPVRTFAVAPDGRRAVAAGGSAGRVTVVDLRRRRVFGPIAAGKNPAQIAFLGRFALVRNAGSPDVTWIDVRTPSRSNAIALGSSPATSLAITPDGRRAILAAPKDQKVFGLHSMMGRPMLMEAEPNPAAADAALVAGGGLQRTGPRTLELWTVLSRSGTYRFEVQLPGRGRAVFKVPVNDPASDAVTVRAERRVYRASAGERVVVAFGVKGRDMGEAQVLAYSTGAASNQLRVAARRVAAGRYQAELTAPQPGIYRVQLESEQAGIGARSGPGATLRVGPAGSDAAAAKPRSLQGADGPLRKRSADRRRDPR
jgi:DNA-binding beta-propeller fold protein YncE